MGINKKLQFNLLIDTILKEKNICKEDLMEYFQYSPSLEDLTIESKEIQSLIKTLLDKNIGLRTLCMTPESFKNISDHLNFKDFESLSPNSCANISQKYNEKPIHWKTSSIIEARGNYIDEIDVPLNHEKIKSGDFDYIKDEITAYTIAVINTDKTFNDKRLFQKYIKYFSGSIPDQDTKITIKFGINHNECNQDKKIRICNLIKETGERLNIAEDNLYIKLLSDPSSTEKTKKYIKCKKETCQLIDCISELKRTIQPYKIAIGNISDLGTAFLMIYAGIDRCETSNYYTLMGTFNKLMKEKA